MDRFARRVYTIAGIYGLIVMLPQYFYEPRIARNAPPILTHPEHFYGFVGVTVAWQIAFLVIARDPQRFRALMPVTVLEKLAFALPVLVLWAKGRLAGQVLLPFAGIDLLFGALFLVSYVRTKLASRPDGSGVAAAP